jgi:hypothetical protein
VQRGTDSACTRVRREAGKGAGDDADYARMRRRLAVPLGSNVRRVRRFTFSTLQLRGLMGESELMIARRDKVSRGLSARESTLISETDQLRQAPAKKIGVLPRHYVRALT